MRVWLVRDVPYSYYSRMEGAMPKATLLTLGEAGFLALPQEVLDRLKVKVGDELLATETTNGYHIARDGTDPDDMAKQPKHDDRR